MAKTISVQGGLLAKAKENQVATASGSPLQQMLNNTSVQARFNKMLGDEADSFLSSLLTVVNDSKLLRNADPRTILSAAATAASLKMPILPSLGKAYIVPFKGAGSFVLGYKGCIELAQRSGKMKFITAFPCYEGMIEDWDPFTETFTKGKRKSDTVVGYYASFQLLNGFTKATFWTVDEVKAHAKRFSKSVGNGPWVTDFDAMACKTVLLSILKTYAPMSIKMQQAMVSDGTVSAINEEGDIETFDVVDVEAEPIEQAEEQTQVPADFEVPME